MQQLNRNLSNYLSQSAFNKLNIIQNRALNIINRKSSSSEIKKSLENLEVRLNNLNPTYFIKVIQNDNEIIKELFEN